MITLLRVVLDIWTIILFSILVVVGSKCDSKPIVKPYITIMCLQLLKTLNTEMLIMYTKLLKRCRTVNFQNDNDNIESIVLINSLVL